MAHLIPARYIVRPNGIDEAQELNGFPDCAQARELKQTLVLSQVNPACSDLRKPRVRCSM